MERLTMKVEKVGGSNDNFDSVNIGQFPELESV
jgi:hypothetical protein